MRLASPAGAGGGAFASHGTRPKQNLLPATPHSLSRHRRRVLGYYSGEEDALDMRKATARDPKGETVRPLPRPVTIDELRASR